MNTSKNRVVFLDYLKSFIIVLIVAHHASTAYSIATGSYNNLLYSAATIIDSKKLFIFDYFESFNDIYFMPLMFMISGFFVYNSLKKRGSMRYIKSRFNRLMVPFIFSMTILMPLSYYPLDLLKNQNMTLLDYISKDYIMNFYQVPGPIWFLLALFIFDVLVSLIYKICPNKVDAVISDLENMGKINFVLSFLSITILVFYLSYLFIPQSINWNFAKMGPIWFQKHRSLMYFSFFVFGFLAGATTKYRAFITRENSVLTNTWLFRVIISAMLFGLFRYFVSATAKHEDYLIDFIYCALFVFIVAAVSSAWIATVAKFASRKSRVLNSLSEQAFGIFIFHFIIVVWMQYFLVNLNLGASQKFYIVFIFSLSLSWLITKMLRRFKFIKKFI